MGGPHQVFTQIERQCSKSFMSLGTYFVQQLTLVRMGYQVNPDAHLLSCNKQNFGDSVSFDSNEIFNTSYKSKTSLKKSKLFESVENAGSEISYRCVNCRDCVNCKKSQQIECISIQEEVEQNIIDNSVNVDIERGVTVAKLPFFRKSIN